VNTTDDLLTWWVCGRCKSDIPYLKTQRRQEKCPECGWVHGERSDSDVPSEIKLNLSDID